MKHQLTKLEKFLTADYDAQFALLADPETKSEVQAWMGPDAFQQFLSFAPSPASHLGVGPKNILFAPGVMGCTLESKGLGGVWWLDVVRARDKLNELRLTDDGAREIDEDADVKPGTVDQAYIPFRKAVATSGTFGGSIEFPYDWRKSFRSSVDLLRDEINQVFDDYQKPVHLVGHSMGGLMIRAALMVHGKDLWKKVGRIVFIGTPHYGSTSIAGYLKNHLWGWEEVAVLAMFLSRETFRSLRGVLSLLPAPKGIYPGTRHGEDHPCANFDMYDAQAWKLGLNVSETLKLQNILDEVKQFYTDLYNWHTSLLQEYKDRMLMIAGVGQETLFRLEFDAAFWGLWEKTKKITHVTQCDVNRDGDGRVPLASAELEDVTIRYVIGQHGGLHNIPAVARDTITWISGGSIGDLKLSKTCAGAQKSHLSAEDQVSSAPLLEGSTTESKFRDLPDYENPTPQFRAKIESDLDAGRIPQVNLVKIL
jgi:pimeloyl-ACP methyl ester carboxylesterase